MKSLAVIALMSTTLALTANICPAANIPDAPALLWQYSMGTEPGAQPAATAKYIIQGTRNGKILTFDHRGKMVWSRSIEGSAFDAPALITDSLVIIGSDLGILYAFDITSGTTEWEYDTDDSIQGAAALTGPDSVAVIGQGAGSIHTLSLLTGKLKWKVEETNRCDGAPSATDGKLVFGNCDAAIHIYDTKSGKKIRSIDLGTDGQVAGRVALKGNIAVTGTYGGDVVCADISTGKIKWALSQAGAATHATPAITGKHVIAASNSGTVSCIELESGKVKWLAQIKGQPESPLVINDRVLLSANGVLYILSLADGREIWSYEISDNAKAPVIAGKMIIVAGDDGSLNAFGAK